MSSANIVICRTCSRIRTWFTFHESGIAMNETSTNPRVRAAVEAYGSDDTNCSQAIVMAYCDEVGIDPEMARGLVWGLGGGIGGMGLMCGALTAATCVVSARCAQEGYDKSGTYEKVREACELFEDRMGTMDCADILNGEVPRPLCCQRAVQVAAECIEEVCGGL